MKWPFIVGAGSVLLALLFFKGKEKLPKISFREPPPGILKALKYASEKTGVPLNMLKGVAYTESRYDIRAVSPVGAMGLMQLMPVVVRSYGITDPFNPIQNALGGAKFLSKYHRKYGNWPQTLAAYNWGPGNVNRNPAKNQWPKATQIYVDRVLARSA